MKSVDPNVFPRKLAPESTQDKQEPAMMIERALFTSARTPRGPGYQLVCRGVGIDALDAQALERWCPSHDSLVDDSELGKSLNLWSLPSGRMCLSHTSTAGPEYSGRGGWRVWTVCFIFELDLFDKYQGHALLLWDALRAVEADVIEPTDSFLPAIKLRGSARTFPANRAFAAAQEFGVKKLASLAEALALREPVLAFAPQANELLVAGALTCLPENLRQTVSFATGLKLSAQRNFQWVVLPQPRDDAFARGRLAADRRQFDFSASAPLALACGHYGEELAEVLAHNDSDKLQEFVRSQQAESLPIRQG